MRKFFVFFILVVLAFGAFLVFNKQDSPTGNVVLNTEEQNEALNQVVVEEKAVVEETTLKDIRAPVAKKYSVNGITTLKPYYVLYQGIRDNSEGKFVNVHYKISSDYPVEFLLFPTYLDMISYAELKNLGYHIYQCGGVAKNLEGDCLVNNVGFAIWNKDGGVSTKINYELKFSNVEISPERAKIMQRIQHS